MPDFSVEKELSEQGYKSIFGRITLDKIEQK